MAVSFTLKDRISFGNLKLRVYSITDASNTGSTLKTGLGTVWAVKAINNTDTADTFGESVGAKTSASTRGDVTVTPVTANDDGIMLVWGR